MAIKRIWHGWTTHDDADAYQAILRKEVFPSIAKMEIPGYRGVELLRCHHESEVEFVTIMTFDSLQNVIDFQGEDYTRAYVPESAQQVLKRWDEISQHYEALL
jgi:heme-degrading monooxygenase HmoA